MDDPRPHRRGRDLGFRGGTALLLTVVLTLGLGCSGDERAPTVFHKKKPKRSAQEKWREATIEYAAEVNAYIERGAREGWENAGEPPTESEREAIADQAVAAIRAANESGKLAELRDQWPPAQQPLISILEKEGQSLPVVCILPDGSLVLRIGTPYRAGRTVHIVGDEVRPLNDIGFFGRSPNRRYFAIARADGIEITDGWQGPRVALCPWPTGLEDAPEGFEVEPFSKPPTPTRLIPYPDGTQVLLVSSDGIFVCSPREARRLLPSKENLREHFEWLRKEYPGDELSMDIDMEHGAVSHSGRWIAVGSQVSSHLIFDAELNLVGDVGHLSEYPHYAIFSSDDSMIAFNSCHLYNGATVGVPTSQLPGLKTARYKKDLRTPILEDSARVYAGVGVGDSFICGDASGDVIAFDKSGRQLWHQFVGSTVDDIDVSADGKTMAVTTCAGFLAIFQLGAGKQAPHQIGNGNHLEVRRWIFWKNEKKPLIW